MDSLQILKDNGFTPISDLNYCSHNGVEYYIGHNENKAAIVALIHSEDIYFINKNELREMSYTAKIAGIESVELFTNYGIELHSKYEKPSIVGFSKIHKIIN